MKLEQMKIKELLDTSHTIAEKLFEGHEYPWEVLGDINEFIESLGASLPENEYKKIGKNIWIHKTAQMAPTTAMGGPMIIGPKVQIRNGAFLRGSVILGQHVVIGNSCEIKNSIIFDEAQVPHFNYVGDSILGCKAHMGAGAVTSNLKSDKSLVVVKNGEEKIATGRKKLGALVGDGAEVGCNSVLCPGSVLGRRCQIYPTSCVRGVVAPNHIYKDAQHIVPRT